jgi:hypothetical protein
MHALQPETSLLALSNHSIPRLASLGGGDCCRHGMISFAHAGTGACADVVDKVSFNLSRFVSDSSNSSLFFAAVSRYGSPKGQHWMIQLIVLVGLAPQFQEIS